MTEKQITINGITVHVEGQGDETIVMVHGWPDTYRLWDLQVAELKKRYQCVRFTLPGFDIDKPIQGYTHQQISDFIKAVVDTTSPNKKAILMLHDWGAVYGYQFCMQYPQSVSKIIGIDVGDIQGEAFANSLSVKAKLMILSYQMWLAMAWRIKGAVGNRMSRFMAKALKCPTGPEYNHAGMCHPYYVRWFGGIDSFKNLAQLEPTCPMLFLYGQHKPIMFHTPHLISKLTSRPGSGAQGFACGHWIMLEQPDPFNRVVSDWLQASA